MVGGALRPMQVPDRGARTQRIGVVPGRMQVPYSRWKGFEWGSDAGPWHKLKDTEGRKGPKEDRGPQQG